MDTCILCKSSKKDEIQYGEYLKNKHFGVHTFCLYLSSNLSQNGEDDEGFLGFLEADIKQEVQRIASLKCCYCQKKYANIGCCEKKCRRTFHFICGLEHKAENQFCNDYRSFCQSHVRSVKQRPAANETCLICYDSLCGPQDKFNTVNMILSPCCRNGWFHKLCLQKFAKTAGYFFKCPLCNDSGVFRKKLPARGIFIPNQDAAWELEPNAFAELLERPNECSAQQCKNRKGRKASCDLNPFVMCSTCGSTAMHRQCLPNGGKRFHCADCTIALEEDDSGRESLNLPGNRNHNEDEEIDVCHVSDREDFDIVNRLMAAQTREPQTKRDSGTHHHDSESSDEEEIKPIAATSKTRRLKSDSETSDLPQVSKTNKCSSRYCRLSTDTESSKNNSDLEEIKTTNKPNSRRLKTDSESSDIQESKTPHEDNSSLTEDENLFTSRKRKSTTIVSDCEDETTKEIATKHKRLEKQTTEHDEQDNLSLATEDSSEDDDDPLENFTKIMERQKNISCIALRTRRSINSNKPPENSTQLLKPHINNEKENIKNEANRTTTKRPSLEQQATTKDGINERQKRKKCVELKAADDSDKETKFDISCIAKRTRRKSMVCWRNNKPATETLMESKENPLNVSCIAVRTRRKTICAETKYTQESLYEMSRVYEKLHESEDDEDDDDEDETDFITGDESDEESVLNQVLVDTDLDKFIVNDGYEEKDSKFEISCIAKRTRTRKSVTTRLQNIPEESDVSTDSCSSSNNSSSKRLSSSSELSNVNIRKRCPQRINSSSSSEEFESPQPTSSFASSRQLLKRKPGNCDLLLDKLPQHNYAAYLKSKYTTKSSTNDLHNYHPPPNHYHPHSSNRKRF
ncbi:dentin sialophosphoprotein-like [Calliphora vicina]|uniref:dentin sialophosphoprotein-like n=1 Tax=Calliphora vicina TaxID=7373 RepID=UPI00325B2781